MKTSDNDPAVEAAVGCGKSDQTDNLWRLPGYLRPLQQFKEQNPWVSKRSRFMSDVWNIDLPQPSEMLRERLDFRDVGPDLAAELKLAVIASVVHPGLRRSSIATGATYGRSLITVGGWMSHVGLVSISELGDDAGDLFLQGAAEFVAQLADGTLSPTRGDWDPRGRNADHKSHPLGHEGRLTFSFVEIMARALLKLQADGDVLARLAGARVSGKLFELGNSRQIALEWAEASERAVERLPDPVLKAVIDGARRMMGVPAEDVIRLVENFRKNLWDGLEAEEAAERLRKFRFKRVPGEGRSWRKRLVSKSLPPLDAIRYLVHLIRDAAIILELLGIGNRPSEALGLMGGMTPRPLARANGPMPVTGPIATTLPRCVTECLSKSGFSVEVLLHGHVFKGNRQPKPVTWLVGLRHDGAPDPYALEALMVLERLFAPLREYAPEADRDHLIVDFDVDSEHGFAMHRLSVGRLGQQFKASIPRFIDLSELPDEHEGRDLRRYRDSGGRCIAMYQCRKTYAQVHYRIDPNLMPAITRQLQNVSSKNTKTSYVTEDPQFRRELEVERSHHTVMLMERVMDGVVTTEGGMANTIDRVMSRLGGCLASPLNDELWAARVESDDRVFGHGALRPRAGIPNILADLRGPRDVVSDVETAARVVDPRGAGREGPALLRRLVSDRRRWLEDLSSGFGALGRPAKDMAVEATRRLSGMGFQVPRWPEREGNDA